MTEEEDNKMEKWFFSEDEYELLKKIRKNKK